METITVLGYRPTTTISESAFVIAQVGDQTLTVIAWPGGTKAQWHPNPAHLLLDLNLCPVRGEENVEPLVLPILRRLVAYAIEQAEAA